MPIRIPSHLTPAGTGTDPVPGVAAPVSASDDPDVAGVEPGTVPARALYEVWSGAPAVVVASPPGAGKTHLVSTVAANLAAFGGTTCGVACNTVAQVIAVANRIAADSPDVTVAVADSSRGSINRARLSNRVRYATSFGHGADITVATLAKWTSSRTVVEVLLVDEAWQTTWANFMQAADVANQFLLVGDPGQIPPIVTTNTQRFVTMRVNPASPAPVGLIAQRPGDVSQLRFDATRRLQPSTVEVISPLYDFAFTSAATPAVVDVAGSPLPEIDRIMVEHPNSTLDDRVFTAVADRIIEIATSGQVVDSDGARPATVIAMAAHRNQIAGIHTALRGRLDPAVAQRVHIDTFDSCQGLEASAAVCIDPLVGQWTMSEHGSEPGRLCVGLSRHTAHLTFVSSPNVFALIGDANDEVAAKNRVVRDRLGAVARRSAPIEI